MFGADSDPGGALANYSRPLVMIIGCYSNSPATTTHTSSRYPETSGERSKSTILCPAGRGTWCTPAFNSMVIGCRSNTVMPLSSQETLTDIKRGASTILCSAGAPINLILGFQLFGRRFVVRKGV